MDAEIKQKILEYLQKTETFCLEQCPDIVQQALRYHFVSNLISIITCSVILFGLLLAAYMFYFNPVYDEYGHRTIISVMGCIVPLIFCPMLFIAVCHYSDNLIEICLAPKYFLLRLFV